MSGSKRVVAACAGATLASVAAYAWLTNFIGVWIDPFFLFRGMLVASKVILAAIAILLGLSVWLAFRGRSRKPRMSIIAAASAGLGVLGALYVRWAMNWTLRPDGPVSLIDFSTSYLEAACLVAAGSLVTVLVLLLPESSVPAMDGTSSHSKDPRDRSRGSSVLY